MSEMESAAQTASTETAAPAAPAATEPMVTSASSDPAMGGGEAPAYQPSYKFTVMGKEHEIPEPFRAAIKDPDTEKQAREIFERAYGLDHVKQERARIQEELKAIKPKYEERERSIAQLQKYIDNKDLGSFLAAFKVPEKALYEHALKMAQYEEMTPEQKQMYDHQRELQRKQYELEQQTGYYREAYEGMMANHRLSELQQTLQSPEADPIVKAFDARHGEGAFANQVIERGRYFYTVHGRDLSAKEVVSQMVAEYGAFMPQGAQPQAGATPTTQSRKDLPVIPATGSGAGSPAQRSVKSIEDLQRLYKEKYGRS